MSISTSETVAVTAAAPIEGNISTEHPYTHLVYVSVPQEKNYKDVICKLVVDHLKGCGRVDLVKIDAIIITSAPGATVKIGFAEAGSSLSIDQVSTKPNGVHHVANAFNVGIKVQESIIPEDTFSRQLQPVSSMLPTPQIYISTSKDVMVTMVVFLKVHGVVTLYSILN